MKNCSVPQRNFVEEYETFCKQTQSFAGEIYINFLGEANVK